MAPTEPVLPSAGADGAHRALLGIAVLAPCAYAVTTLSLARIAGQPLDWLAEAPRLGMLALCAVFTYRTCRLALHKSREAIEARRASEARISDHEREVERLAQELDDAKGATREQHVFLGRLAHQLRAPMDGVLATTELALAGELGAEQRDLLMASRDSGRTLLRAVDHVLDAARAAEGERPVTHQPVDLHELLSEALGRHAEQASCELACRLAPDLPGAVLSDREHLARIVDHLLAHAVAVAGRGTVVVASEHDGELLRLTVSHGGAGRASAATERVRSRWAADAAPGDEGLGPAVAARLVALLGGRLFAESEAGMGGRLVVELPCPAVDDGAAVPVDLSGRAVLVADRSMTSRAILADTLEAWGARVFTVEGGGEALDALELAVSEARPYDAVLLGADLPERGTFERRHERTTAEAPCAVVVLGGAPGEGGVPRPVLPRTLGAALVQALAKRPAHAGD